MSNSKLTTQEISEAVKAALLEKEWTILDCCNAYNSTKKNEPKLNKDFVQRIKNNRFEVVSKRVINLCKFLAIDIARKEKYEESHFHEEILKLEKAVQNNPVKENRIKDLLRNIAEIVEVF